MNEDEAIEKAFELLKQEGTVESGKALRRLSPYISVKKFGNIWEAFLASTPIETVIELSNQ